MNNGLNSNQTFKSFWSDEEMAKDADGMPLATYMPIRFDTPNIRRRVFKYPEEGWYDCKIRRIRSKFNLTNINSF